MADHISTPRRPAALLTCAMVQGCDAPITHLDTRGYVYCTRHGQQRQRDQRCRKLRQYEIARLARGEQVERY